jgi:hypothetical protein
MHDAIRVVNELKKFYHDYEFNVQYSDNNGFVSITIFYQECSMLIEYMENQNPVVLQLLKNNGFERKECGAIMNQMLELF